MKNRERIGKIVSMWLLTMALATSISVWLIVFPEEEWGNINGLTSIWIFAIALFVGSTVAIISMMYIRVFRETPSTLTISVLGYPNSGKTVYLTVLFNELLSNAAHDKISFVPYGSETMERVLIDYGKLKDGHWLTPTPSEGVFYYRAAASFSKYRKYKLEIGDYAGEKFKEELKENNNFFHKTEYFQYVISSDIVFLAVDTELVLVNWNDGQYITNVENSFISALALMQASKNMGFNKQIKFPVALIFLKSDLLKDFSQKLNLDNMESQELPELILEKFRRIIGYCNKNCIHYKHFFVSSTGTSDIEHLEGEIIPQGVVKPVEWSIQKHHAW